ncbi:ATP-binding protein [Dechloromonas denitrificans]|uniref:hybrid sensor histidine kinase/response regulator n=1 Tax=Dechloromonas denitrificans TaxID=281362 RepID=UPI001CF8AEC8|nr:ATP-binding protein [Dechloromonas denitrificans]UCV05280.1 response regulator [Dechloromonas denitrificans]
MKKNPDIAARSLALRRLAEERATKDEQETDGTSNVSALLHELRVHKIELEMQNEALRESYHQAEAALARYTDLYDFAPIGYVTLSRDGKIQQINLAGARLLGLGRSKLVNKSFALFIDEASRPTFAGFLNAVWASPTKQVSEITIPSLEEQPARVIQVKAIRDETGQEYRLLLIDITTTKQTETSLKQAMADAERANCAKSRFLAAASHDLRQPLAGLALYIAALEHKLGASDQQLVSGMKNCAATLSEMLSHLLDLSKLEAGVVVPKPCDFELDALLKRVVSSYGPEARSKGLKLRHTRFGLTGRTDPVLFQRIVGNLVDNAIRYTAHGGVLIGCKRRQGKMWLEVWDTGIGIPADKTGEIFEEFKQLDNRERNSTKGSGLGLAIVTKMASLLGLQINLCSRLGKGSVFAVELPLGEAAKPMPPVQEPHIPLIIGVVDDNAELVKALTYALAEIGHQVVSAPSGAELLARLGGNPPNLIISDYRLAGNEDGFNVIATLRKNFGSQLPALIITGDTDPQVIRRMARKQIVVLHKPLSLDVLRTRIAELTRAVA